MSARRSSILRSSTAKVFLVLWVLALCPQEFWHHCFEAHAETAVEAPEGNATVSAVCAVCDAPAPIGTAEAVSAEGILLPFIGQRLVCADPAPERTWKWQATDRGPPQLFS